MIFINQEKKKDHKYIHLSQQKLSYQSEIWVAFFILLLWSK